MYFSSLSGCWKGSAAEIILEVTDFNRADRVVAQSYRAEWRELKHVLETMPLHLKASDQAGKLGAPIFDPVGTNAYIRAALTLKGWAKIPIPAEFSFLGTGIDFGKKGLIAEAQFSNYPFLLNNTVRSELFFKSKIALAGRPMKLAVIIAKAHMFPASNSTLYYQQAVHQLTSLSRFAVFDVPIRLVGLFVSRTGVIPAVWTGYTATRYSRTIETRMDRRFVASSRTPDGRCVFSLIAE